jgi:hypothetical protein
MEMLLQVLQALLLQMLCHTLSSRLPQLQRESVNQQALMRARGVCQWQTMQQMRGAPGQQVVLLAMSLHSSQRSLQHR